MTMGSVWNTPPRVPLGSRLYSRELPNPSLIPSFSTHAGEPGEEEIPKSKLPSRRQLISWAKRLRPLTVEVIWLHPKNPRTGQKVFSG